jgi:hypothetical protein
MSTIPATATLLDVGSNFVLGSRGQLKGARISGRLRPRFWASSALFLVSSLILACTAAWPTWIEGLFGIDPDGGSGMVEWAITGALITVAVGSAVLARWEWRRAGAGV